ncbi:MAG: tetratricopeptide repeat protein [Deltaproteobacteria bacterium]|nr:tetratricopeptide repeat protein [Deltaproteobacteria bacterium]
MSILKWITGGTFAEHKAEGERFFAEGNAGEARLSFQRALKKSKDCAATDIEDVKAQIALCANQLAMQRLEQARALFAQNVVEKAYETLDDVLLICNSPELAEAVEQCRTTFDNATAEAAADAAPEMTDDDLLAVIAGSWSAAMAAEFAQYPEGFYHALMTAHDGDVKQALTQIQKVAEEIDLNEARYLFLEIGRLQLQSEDLAGAEESIRTFVNKAENDGDEDVEELWLAWQMLASIHTAKGDFDGAEKALIRSYRAAPDNHVPLLQLGTFLRERGELERAKRSLQNAMDTMGAIHPDMRVFRELGLTYLAMNAKKEAIDCFKTVLDHFGNTVGHDQYDPEAAVPLARLLEEQGKLKDASDIYRHLANGYDTENLYLYNLEAARLLLAQNADTELMVQYLDAAGVLARTEEQRNAVDGLRRMAE